jgi:trk system potassium uptake protein TrkH
MRERQVLSQTLGALGNDNLGWVLLNVLRFSVIAEGIGVLLLTLRFSFEMPFATALWHALFHCVSAFCNAGFSLNDTSLIEYQGDWIVNLTICGLIVFGGIGFPVILDLLRHHRGTTWMERVGNLQLHTKIMLVGTAVLIVGGAVSIFFIEYDHALRNKPLSSKILIPIFQSITCRTAGFNTVDQADLTSASLCLSIFLMLIGGGPCSTAGGVKVTSIYMLVLKAWSRLRGQMSVTIFRRTIPQSSLDKASTVVLFYVFMAALALIFILLLEQAFGTFTRDDQVFLPTLFEVISALGTVGLSINLTSTLSDPSLFVLMMLMFFGRLGPVSVFAAMSMPSKEKPLQFVSEEPLVG